MRKRSSKTTWLSLSAAACVLLPLAGVWLSGRSVVPYLQFPPLTGYVAHAPFNRVIFGAGALFFLFSMGSLFYISYNSLSLKRDFFARPFPWWGWGGLLLCICAWVLAWNRFVWFSILQPYTFFPLWMGYILSVNGVTYRRSGTCLLLGDPGRFFLLFPVSAVFWWYFEWLNRFVQNWYYVGVDDFSAFAYVLHATLCFSTVLPAVISTVELLATFFTPVDHYLPDAVAGFSPGVWMGRFILVVMAVILAALPMAPDQLFPFVWIAPLFIMAGMQGAVGRPLFFSLLLRRNMQLVLLPALAGLVCGFFWEMWNWKSLAHWQYSIPYVDRYHIFAMPILGYLGYLPFGLECQMVAFFIIGLLPAVTEQDLFCPVTKP